MPETVTHTDKLEGLTSTEVTALRKIHGKNVFSAEHPHRFVSVVWGIVKEPMFILLVIACSLYFILGEESEGVMMLVAMLLVTAISLYQEVKSGNAIQALQKFTEPKVRVIRDSQEFVLNTEELVPGDIILLAEGMNIPADAIVLQDNDFSVNESIITGESLPVDKQATEGNNMLYQGTSINSGKCIARVLVTGNNTVLGKIGKEVSAFQSSKTLLQVQINRFVRNLALFGLIAFLVIFLVNYLHYGKWTTSLLFALTLAMSAVPEEIPVAFSSFMALGAFKMSKLGIISRVPQVVENLGAVSVLCLDKTGTITENSMQVKHIYDYERDALIDMNENQPPGTVLYYGVLASETNPFDAMEKAIDEAYRSSLLQAQSAIRPRMIFEYPLEGQPPMMTHVYKDERGQDLIAGKGAAERIIRVCGLSDHDKTKVMQHVHTLASHGYRVIGVARSTHAGSELPVLQDNFNWIFVGLLALYDPPKGNIREVLACFYKAEIAVKLITGDYSETAMNIAGQSGIHDHLTCVTGEDVGKMDEQKLRDIVKTTNVFARMYPGAKLKVINAIKANGEIVAMTGDGVNDGPALKAADIGIAMGRRGTEIARQAADLVLTDDNLERIVTAIREGRKIFSNLKKAIRYIISIHIPIILTASLPVILGWRYPNIFTPIHVIFLELIMGPTCSIFFEREPVEENIMQATPRERNTGIFTRKELLVSISQGLVIAAGTIGLYYYSMNTGASLEVTRTIVFTCLILSNVFLTFADRSFSKTIIDTSRFKNVLAPFLLLLSGLFLAALHLNPSVRNLFRLSQLTQSQFLLCFCIAFLSVMWFEVYKSFLLKPRKIQKQLPDTDLKSSFR